MTGESPSKDEFEYYSLSNSKGGVVEGTLVPPSAGTSDVLEAYCVVVEAIWSANEGTEPDQSIASS